MRKILYIFCLVITFVSCEKKNGIGPNQLFDNTKNDTPITSPKTENRKGVFIVNEGNFNWGNASLSYYDKYSKDIENNIFKTIANTNLGDVFQSVFLTNYYVFLVVNNSDKIEVLSREDLSYVKTIPNIPSPRYMLQIDSERAIVSSLYGNKIIELNTSKLEIENELNVNGWIEEMLLANNKIYACNTDNNQVLILNSENLQLEDSILVGEKPTDISIDADGNIWVLCIGVYGQTVGGIYQISPTTKSVLKSFLFSDNTMQPSRLTTDLEKNNLYYLYNGVNKLNIYDNSLPSSSVIPANGSIFYGLGLDLENGDIYVSDAKDYVQEGDVYRFDKNYNQIDKFAVGIIPGNFTFD